jgi:hypothetical protein
MKILVQRNLCSPLWLNHQTPSLSFFRSWHIVKAYSPHQCVHGALNQVSTPTENNPSIAVNTDTNENQRNLARHQTNEFTPDLQCAGEGPEQTIISEHEPESAPDNLGLREFSILQS